MKTLKNDLTYVLFAKEYDRFAEPKTKRKAFQLVECAIVCLARKGFGQVTLEMIAREAGVSRSLIRYYFKDMKEVEVFALKYIRYLSQKLVVDALENLTHPKEMMIAYVNACLSWADRYRTHGLVWLSFIHLCGSDKANRLFNTTAVEIGTSRLQSLIELGKAQAYFKCDDSRVTARTIQVIITGALCSFASEDIADKKKFSNDILAQCLALLSFSR